MAAAESGGEDLTRRERREEYERVLRIVDAQTSKAQPPMAKRTSITQIASRLGLKYEKRIKGAIQHGDLLAYDGRLGLADKEAILERLPHEDDPDHLRTLATAEVRGPSRSEVIGEINTRLSEVDDE